MIGLEVGEAETEAFWREFLRSLRARGLRGVRLCVSDCHEGLRAAIGQVLGCPWQRCTVHFLRNMLGHCAKSQQPMISARDPRPFTAASGHEARERLAEVIERLEPIAPKVAQLVLNAEADLLGFCALEQNDEWLVTRRYLSQESLSAVLDRDDHTPNKNKEVPALNAA